MNRPFHTGQGGKSLNDRELAAKVRTKALEDIYDVLCDGAKAKKHSKYKKEMLLNLSRSILPRLTELSGPDGGDIPIPIYGGKSNSTNRRHNRNTKDIRADK